MIVIGVASDPVPDNPVGSHDAEGAVIQAYARRIDVIFAMDLFELNAGITRVGLKQLICLSRLFPDFSGQIVEQFPEASGSSRFDQSKSVSGIVSLRSSSSKASWAIRRITSRFVVKRFFHASSSAKSARILDAMASCSSGGNEFSFSNAFSSSADMNTSVATDWIFRFLLS